MKEGEGTEVGVNTTPDRQGGVRALLREALRRVQGTIGAWLGRSRPEPPRPQMPVTASSTQRMLEVNGRLAGWRGILRWAHQGFHLGHILRRHGPGPHLAGRFSQVIASRYGPTTPRAFALALPLAHLPQLMVGSFRGGGVGRATIARSPLSSGRETFRRARGRASTLEVVGPSTALPRPAEASSSLGRGRMGRVGPRVPLPSTGEPSIGMHRPHIVPLSSSPEDVRKVQRPAGAARAGGVSRTILRPAGLPFPSRGARVRKARRPIATLAARRSSIEALQPIRTRFLPSQLHIGGPRHAALIPEVRGASLGMFQPTPMLSLSNRGRIGKLGQMAPVVEAGRASTEMPKPTVFLPPLSLQQDRGSAQPIPALKAREPFEGLLRLAQGVGPVAESARHHLMPERLTRTSLARGTRGQSLSGALPGGARRWRPTTPHHLGGVLARGRGFPLASAAPVAAGLTPISGMAGSEGPRASPAQLLTPRLFAEMKAQRLSLQKGERVVPRSIQRDAGKLAAPAAERITHPEGGPRSAASPQTPIGVSTRQGLRPTVMALPVGLGRSRGEEGTTQSEMVPPAPLGPRSRRPPLRGIIGEEQGRGHPLGLNLPLKSQIGSTPRDLRLSSRAPLQVWWGMGGGLDQSAGRPLAAGPRRAMEQFLGEDLGRVRVHSEPAAARVAAALKAEAFTVGRDIFFGSGRAKLYTPSGMALLGHELTHVGQQRGLHRSVSTSVLKVQSEEREAMSNELTLRRVLEAGEPLALRPISLILSSSGPPASEDRTGGASVKASPSQPLSATRPGVPSMAVDWGSPLARAPADRETADRGSPSSAPLPALVASPPAEPSATQQREGEGRGVDVDAVARQVYDWIMRRLAVERERAGYP